MASNSYKLEIDSLQQVIKIQDYSIESRNQVSDEAVKNFPSKFYVSKNRFRKIGQARIASHILSQQQKIIDTVKNSPTAAKKYYIILWQHIEGSGRAYFQVAFKKDSRKEEFVALSSEKIIRMDSKCQVLQSWWLQTLKEWKINWFADPKRVELMLNKNQKSEEQIEFFIPLTKEGDKEPDRRQKKDLQKLQVIHEYIGGYMFHYMNKNTETERGESEQTLRSILDVTNPWYN